MKDADMPIDAAGNRADVVMDDKSTIKRTNIGRLYEQYINASAMETTRIVREMCASKTPMSFKEAWDYLKGFYDIVSPVMTEFLPTEPTDQLEHVYTVLRNGIFIYLPTDTPTAAYEVVRELRDKYPAVYGPVNYRGKSGNLVTTKSNVLIGNIYMLLLEKVGNAWAGVASAKVQHHGIPAKITRSDQHSTPGRWQPVRIAGESEVRAMAAFTGADTPAELIDQTNSPLAHRAVVNSILSAATPTNIQSVIDRNRVKRGQGRVVVLCKHMLECAGERLVKGSM